VPISPSLQIPLAVRRFFDLEANVDDDADDIPGGGSGEEEFGALLILEFFSWY
jgi:hypothetical protein